MPSFTMGKVYMLIPSKLTPLRVERLHTGVTDGAEIEKEPTP